MKEANREIYQTNMETEKTSRADRYKLYYIFNNKSSKSACHSKSIMTQKTSCNDHKKMPKWQYSWKSRQ